MKRSTFLRTAMVALLAPFIRIPDLELEEEHEAYTLHGPGTIGRMELTEEAQRKINASKQAFIEWAGEELPRMGRELERYRAHAVGLRTKGTYLPIPPGE